MKRAFYTSFGFYLFIFSFIISIIPLALIQIVSHQRTKKEIERNVKSRIEEITKKTEYLFNKKLDQEKDGLKIVGRISPLKDEYIANYFFIYSDIYSRVSRLENNGRSIYSFTPSSIESARRPQPYEIRNDIPGMKIENYDELPLISSFGLVPIKDGYAERILMKIDQGLLLCELRLSKILTNITDEIGLRPQEDLFVVNEQGIIIFSTDMRELNQSVELEQNTYFVSDINHVIKGILKSEGKLRFGMTIYYGSLLQSVNKTLRVGLLSTIVLALFILVMILLSVRWITKKIARLNRGADLIAAGNFDQPIVLEKPAELQSIALRINEMAESLKTLIKEQTYSESFAAIGRFASYFAHDLKSPLEGTFLIASELRNTIPEDEPIRPFYDELIDGLNRMRSLIAGALDFSRANKPNMQPLDLNECISEVIREFTAFHSCEISISKKENELLVQADSYLFKRLFHNLFENSYQSKIDTCQIDVTLQDHSNQITISVKDNGRGIPADRIDTIFEPFQTSKSSGHGFGLAFVRETIKKHSGTVTVESIEGEGTTFFIVLPHSTEFGPEAKNNRE